MTEATFQTLGRYTIQSELGKGGFATVYRALDSMLEREVALKVLKPGWTDDAKAVERFMREAKQASRLKHPNIVTIFDVGQAEGRLFIAMELVPGRSLQRIVAEDGPLLWSRALAILEQTAAALDYAHKQGLVHRDIKPANIILDESTSDGEVHVVLTDFGLVRGAEQASLSTGSTGGLIGTPEYIAPEIWDGEAATIASDVYALGCTAYYILTGRVMFGATTPVAVLKRHVEGPKFPSEWPSGVPADLTDVLRRTLAKEQDQRQATASEVVAAMRACEALAISRKMEEAGRKAQEEAERKQREQMQIALAAEIARKAKEETERRARQDREREAARVTAEKARLAEAERARQSKLPSMVQKEPATKSKTSPWPYIVGAIVVVAVIAVLAVNGTGKPSKVSESPTEAPKVQVHANETATASNYGTWNKTTVLPQPMGTPFVGAGKQLIIFNKRAYVFGGKNASNTQMTDVYFSAVNADVSLGSWVATTSLPVAVYDQAVVQVGSFVYLITGANGATAVYYARVNNDGTLGVWTKTKDLQPTRQNFAAVSDGTYIYVSGGNSDGTKGFVKFTSVKPDGSLNAWVDTAALPQPMEGHVMVATNGYLYALAPNSTVYYAPLNADGTVDAWTATTSLPQPMSGYAAFAYDNRLYLLGGGSLLVYSASIQSNGALGQWQTIISLPVPRAGLWAGAEFGVAYAVGGYAEGNYTDSADYLPIPAAIP